ncbi:hypothetical protein GGS23DRAFT_228747 [Durotheca rogersii]|uniref:uncharacterized protein n=1 Tax=Durotheca rogersii TaxID=419775 RepID=UPI002220693E|nr:uncharacterized protein GGS23DRAFT_228747 [Durotheca rogersii]KAI5860555.1 hypothetical protein GGS23DRAFT_228747 [Durotheca rogersii]
MTEVVPADRTRLLQSKRAECSEIARSRKRKLCVLYAVATTSDGLPQRSFADPDAQPANTAESHFLEGCDILQGRKLNELNIPARPRPRIEYSQLPVAREALAPSENTVAVVVKKQDVRDAVRPVAAPPPPASSPPVTSRPEVDDGQTDRLPNIAPALPASGATPKLQPARPTQPLEHPTRAAGPRINSNEQPHPKPPSTSENAETIAKNITINAIPAKVSAGLPTSSPSLPHLHIIPTVVGEQRQVKPEPDLEDAQRQDRYDGEPMDVEFSPSRNEENTDICCQGPQPVVSGSADAASSPSSTTQTATTPYIPDTSANTSPDHDGAPVTAGVEVKVVEFGGVRTLGPDSHSLTPGHTLNSAGTVLAPENTQNRVETLPIPEPTSTTTTKVVSNGVKNIRTPTEPALPEVSLPTPYGESSPVNFGRSGQPEPPDPPQTPNDAFRGPTQANAQSNQQQIHQKVREVPVHPGAAPQIKGSLAPSRAAGEAMTKETLVASEPGAAPDQAGSEGPRPPSTPPQTPVQPPRLDHQQTSGPTGAAQQKPVSEILAEPPNPSGESEPNRAPLVIPGPQSSRKPPQSILRKARLKEKSKQSTVIFGKQPRRASSSARTLVQNRPKPGQMPSDDYFTPLFVQSFTSTSKWMKPLDQLLHQAHKTLSTPDSYTQILDNQACKVLRRVYQLQHHDKWSLRQPKRCPEPTRQPCHWDVLLKEMKWMRTDFREERKWKMAAARNLAYACAEWVSSSLEDRKALQVNSVIPPLELADINEASVVDAHHAPSAENQPTPDLITSTEADSPLEPDDEPHEVAIDTIAPSALFCLENDDVVFALHQSPTTDRLLEELPMYGSPLKVPKSDLTAPEYDPDASWRRPALPLTKFVEGRMELTSTGPPQKRSRYRYSQEDDEDDEVVFGQSSGNEPCLEPQSPNVALFRPENKSIRDRLHAGHQFRPPNEHTMPFQSFYESRSPSQWMQSEDDELKSLVREYSYNWSLISSMLSSRSLFSSGAERRTPWECFERWVGLEGLPHDMQKTQYFKLWQGRIESSQQVIFRQNQSAMQQQAQQQQAGSNGPPTPVPRRRFTVPLKVERRRNQKHLTMIDAMRKLAKKRETAIQKQQHAASLAAMRKSNEAPQPRAATKTPREYSIMRWERDQAMAERLAERMAQQQRHEAQRRAVLQRAQQGQAAQVATAQNANQLSQNNPQIAASHAHASIPRVNVPNQMPVSGQGRARMPMHATPNGTGAPNHMGGNLVAPMPINGASQVQIPTVNGQSRMAMPNPQPDMQLLLQAHQISEQQRRSVQMRQHQAQHQHQAQPSHQSPQGSIPLQGSPPAMRAGAMAGLNHKSYINNAQTQAMMASFSAANGQGMSTPPAAGLGISPQAGSPRPNTTIPQPTHQTYVAQLQHIETQLRQSHPNTPQDMIREMARQLLNNRQNSHNMAQSAMNAAAGGTGHAAAANGPHQYAQLLRAQQQQQAAAAAAAQAQHAQAQQGGAQHQRNSSGSATPTPSVPK